MLRRLVHLVEGARVERVVSEELVSRAVERVRPRARDDVDLTAARAAHLCRVAAGLHTELLDGVGRRTQVERVEGGVGVGRAV